MAMCVHDEFAFSKEYFKDLIDLWWKPEPPRTDEELLLEGLDRAPGGHYRQLTTAEQDVILNKVQKKWWE